MCCTRVAIKGEGTGISFSGMRHPRTTPGKPYLHLTAVHSRGINPLLHQLQLPHADRRLAGQVRCNHVLAA